MLSSSPPNKNQLNITLLFYRILIAFALIRTHGWKKIIDFQETVNHIPDPFGIGSTTSAYLAVFTNVILAAMVIPGLFTRLSALGIASLTLVGFFLVHWQDPWPVKDVPLMYSIAFIMLIALGPGKFS